MPDLIRNRVTERDIRDWLEQNGYQGGTAKLESVELHAIKRPGWKQLFRFHGTVRPMKVLPELNPERINVWGVALDDERNPIGQQLEVFLFRTEDEQQTQLSHLAADMLTANSSEDRSFGVWSTVLITLFFGAVLFLVALVKNLYE